MSKGAVQKNAFLVKGHLGTVFKLCGVLIFK